MTLSDKIIEFNQSLDFKGKLPEGIRIMNPYRESPEALDVSSAFYKKYYNDNNKRNIILGINPGRFGAGLTGVPFTDPKHLKTVCQIPYSGHPAHEPSSVFIYNMINAFGGPELFYGKFYIGAVSPLGFTLQKNHGKEINYNYYDDKKLLKAVYGFIVESIKKQIDMGMNTQTCFCLGTGKNFKFLAELNTEYKYFEKIIALDHPRYIMQYKAKRKEEYVEKYLKALIE